MSSNEINSIVPISESPNDRSEHYPEALHIDSKEVISAEQVLDVLERFNEKGEHLEDSVTAAVGYALVDAAYRTIDKTVLATSYTRLQLRGVANPTEDQLQNEMVETHIRMADFIDMIKLAHEYVTDQVPFERQNTALIVFFEKEIELLQELDSASTVYSPKSISDAVSILREIRRYYIKDFEEKHKIDELAPAHQHRKAKRVTTKKELKAAKGRTRDDAITQMTEEDSLYD